MAQDCASCFAAFTAPASAGERFAGKLFCTRNAPAARSDNPDAWIWPLVEEDWTCREGADANTGLSYGAIVNGTPGANGAGYGGISSTVLTVASSGTFKPAIQTGLAYQAGARVRITSSTGEWIEGVVSNYAGDGTLTVEADSSSGSGTFGDWFVNIAGETGATGTGVAASGSFTFTASPLVISDAAVQAGSKIILQPTNNTACLLVAGIGGTSPGQTGGPYVSSKSAGVSFTVTCSQSGGGGPDGSETFDYFIFN